MSQNDNTTQRNLANLRYYFFNGPMLLRLISFLCLFFFLIILRSEKFTFTTKVFLMVFQFLFGCNSNIFNQVFKINITYIYNKIFTKICLALYVQVFSKTFYAKCSLVVLKKKNKKTRFLQHKTYL